MSCARNRRHKAAVGAIPHAVFAERDSALVRELHHLVCEKIAGFNMKAIGLLEDAEADALTYLDFPYKHHRLLRTNKVQERVNHEVKHCSRVVPVFPSRKSLIRMLGAVLSEMDEGWPRAGSSRNRRSRRRTRDPDGASRPPSPCTRGRPPSMRPG